MQENLAAQKFWDWMEQFALQYGYFGVFVISFIGSLSIVFPIPYTILIYFLGAVLDPIFLAISGGLGSALGEMSGYILGYYGRAIISEERQKKMDYMLRIFNRYGAVAIFLFALTPLPDDLLFIPLGIMRFSFIRAFIPSFIGKSLMCLILAYGGHFSIKFIQEMLGNGGWWTSIATGLLLFAIIVVMLKVDWEKIFVQYFSEDKGKKET